MIGSKTKRATYKFLKSIWLFPAALTIVLVALSAFQVSGSSIGIYQDIFYGDTSDNELVLNAPRHIRSDEWLVNSQKTIAQKNNDYNSINTNVGNGEDAAVLYDTPYKDWSIIFKPQSIGYLILPFDFAFAFHWWIIAYLLVISCYFFILVILPGRKLLAAILSLSMLFSPFIQWWYQYGTLAPIYYSLFGFIAFIRLLKARKTLHAIGWSVLLAYLAISFALILYPPFQITCALVVLIFTVAYIIDQKASFKTNMLKRNIVYMVAGILIAAAAIGLFVYQHRDVVTIVQNTAYPGKRLVQSGGYSMEHLLSSQLGATFQDPVRANQYSRPPIADNQSEASNFMLLIPFLIIPLAYLLYKQYRKIKKVDYLMLASLITTAILLAWMFIPGLGILGSLTLLDKVPVVRVLIGLGLLNLIFILVFIRAYDRLKERLNTSLGIIYSLIVFIVCLLINFHVLLEFPNFIDYKLAILLAIPFSVIIFLFLRKHYITASSVFLVFSLASTFAINPIYKGTEILTDTPISKAIVEAGSDSNKKWITDDFYLENFATMNGVPSLTGVYYYPQTGLWKNIAYTTDQEQIYNRYAHVNFVFYEADDTYTKPELTLVQGDRFNVAIEPCDQFLRQNNVGFIITATNLTGQQATCTSLLKTVTYPRVSYNIYKLNF